MAIKKTELYSSLWASCDQLRGGMDASQYKDYVLTFLFLKYVSDKSLNNPPAMIVVPDGYTFPDLVKLKGDKEIGEGLNMALNKIGEDNEMPWLPNKDNDFNDEERLGKGKEMVDRLSGGIPNADIEALDHYWQVFPPLQKTLFENERVGYSQARVKASDVKTTILEHPEFKQFADQSLALFDQWKGDANLHALSQNAEVGGESPKDIIHRISENLLNTYTQVLLLDRYDMYQIIMDYWAEVMQDDAYFITQDGWGAANSIKELVVKKGEKLREVPDLIIGKNKYKAELISPALIVQRYFPKQQAEVERLSARVDEHLERMGLVWC